MTRCTSSIESNRDLIGHLGSYYDIMCFQIYSGKEVVRELRESSRLRFSEKVSVNKFDSSDAKVNILGSLN